MEKAEKSIKDLENTMAKVETTFAKMDKTSKNEKIENANNTASETLKKTKK